MYTENPPLAGRASSERPLRTGPHTAYRRAGFKKAQFASKKPSTVRQISRTLARYSVVLFIGAGCTLAWQSHGVETVSAWAPSLGWLLPSPPGLAVTSAELQQLLKPMAIDLALVRRSEERLATNQDQLARKQDQMAQTIATLQAAEQDISQKILVLAAPAPKAVRVSAKPAQPAAE
jgi:hypothetical protein